MEKTNDTQMVTGKVRFSYLTVWEPKAAKGSTQEKFSVSLLIPKTDKVTLMKIKACIEAAKVAGASSKFGGTIPPKIKTPVRDGDTERPGDEVYAGHYFINASANIQPGIIDKKLNPIIDQTRLYSGCYGRADINFYAFNTNGNKGIACGLNNIQLLADGEPLSGKGSAIAAFDDGFTYDEGESEDVEF